MSQSWVPISTILKTAPKLLEKPKYAKNVAMIQVDKFLRNLVPRAEEGTAGRIRQCSIRITDICNLRCHTCGQWGDRGFLKSCSIEELKGREVAPERYIELLRDLDAKGHHPSVYLWGGEPMLYKGSVELIEEAARMGMAPSIATNGTGLVQHAERLVSAPMFVIQISLDGPDEQTHNASRPGANPSVNNFATVSRAIDRIVELRKEKRQRLPLVAALTTINNVNYNRLVDIYERFKDRVDVCVFYLAWWIDQESAERHTLDFEERFGFKPQKHYGWVGNWRPPDYAVLSDQLRRLNDMAASLSGPAVIIMPPLTDPKDLEAYYTDHDNRFGFDRCVSIFSAVEINSNGDMSPCRDYHDYVVGNVKDRTITELWNSAPYRRFRKSLSERGLMPVCSRCCGLMGY
ncbi:MAG: radical SAM protein [Desulfomonile sp.]|nr:radical SAM protein [Desulfomonile sp.]